MGRFSREKGKRGEREVRRLFLDRTGLVIRRDLSQADAGGADFELYNLRPFAIEVKNVYQLKLQTWWAQTVAQALAVQRVPALFFKRPNVGWFVVLPGPWFAGIETEPTALGYEDTVTMHPDLFFRFFRQCHHTELSVAGGRQ